MCMDCVLSGWAVGGLNCLTAFIGFRDFCNANLDRRNGAVAVQAVEVAVGNA